MITKEVIRSVDKSLTVEEIAEFEKEGWRILYAELRIGFMPTEKISGPVAHYTFYK